MYSMQEIRREFNESTRNPDSNLWQKSVNKYIQAPGGAHVYHLGKPVTVLRKKCEREVLKEKLIAALRSRGC